MQIKAPYGSSLGEQSTMQLSSIDVSESFNIFEAHAEYRLSGQLSLAQTVNSITSAIVFARELGVANFLINILRLHGFPSPSLGERYFAVRDWGKASDSDVRVAMVVRDETKDPEKFGVTVAANLGFVADVFTSDHDALHWLRSLSQKLN